MSSDFFVRVHGVKAIAVGGFKDKVLSMFSFPGASVIDTDGYVDTFEKLGVKSTIERLPYSNSASIGVSLVYLENDTLPFEFSAHRFPAALRMDYTPETARHHDKLWAAVAKAVWK
ncbi:hypothetical protein BGW38_010824 [Lunasporangiospora selenospora]|uniref:Uncharacterized protein n=1 Tax=Lunasporangiospora selenospora TaxID=979761 RepID=A0A9P6FVP8_9FUNG|nr:hypothetical protein BGW38_010824 [Lunasporangiospora selenospora]